MRQAHETFPPPTVDASTAVFGAPVHAAPPTMSWAPGPAGRKPIAPQGYNNFAVLAPILAFVVPPAGVVLGHLALPQIRRTGEHGRWAAICGLVLGYALSLVLVVALVAWSTTDSDSVGASAVGSETEAVSPPAPVVPPSVVTSVAPAPITPRVKLDLSKVPVGTCAHIEKRDVGDDALDLFATPCEHGEGVYTVVARVDRSSDCRSTYVAAPQDHSFAVCLSEY
ncbi:MAG: DUF4190 domain-containing protein [Mycobacterium sp.]|uniref:DUF4190 domain-containing protein n=1 Tax=Mycobacterium sp. TaxID=1785 RepID=UPI003F964D16